MWTRQPSPLQRCCTGASRHGGAPCAPTCSTSSTLARAGIHPGPYSAHSLRAGFVTDAHRHGASDRAIPHQTCHHSLATIGTYVRVQQAWTDNAATILGLQHAAW